MNSFLNTISKFDGFFVSFTPSFGLREQRIFYKTVWGGMATIIILTFVLVYSLNQLILWGSGDMIYKVSSQQKTITEGSHLEQLFVKNDPIQLLSLEFMSSINPFESNQMIIIPLLYKEIEEELSMVIVEEDFENILYVDLNNQLNNAFNVILVKCIGNEDFLIEGQECASQDYSEEFFDQIGLISLITVYNEEFDISTKTYQQYETLIDLPFDTILSSEVQIITNYEVIEANQGYLFQSFEEYIVNKGCTSQIYTYTKEYHKKLYERDLGIKEVIGTIAIQMNSSIFYVRNQYPTISEVLASIGSIIQTILLIRYAFYALNRKQMISFMKSTILINYYPEWKEIKNVKENNINSSVLEDKKLNKTSIEKFDKDVSEMLNLKFDYINLIYEIHQMQKILQLITPSDLLLNIHSNESKLQIQKDENSNQFSIKNAWSSFEDYSDTIYQNHFDPFLFSYYWKSKKKNGSLYKIPSNENEQIPKQLKPTQIQENADQVVDELRNQDSKIHIDNNDQIIQD
ncbi:unnamed protein product (macronuclear) [Paramecium tetraurelia]|uniref:Transmembrane protein n=1 Tax=Paramecium tetraurelia TaxID=5888 RepID=A0C925_PARTE|nr:uncharacterized protein GSPATT00006598001 [Paramecium tetraurelia]CAK67292.1 unnamed protein product [Paramecium tetraurelia]|eukprot:XP_001434689.1 hypothetical protein (macronuclear) [Paramecium tetraurelia strain d4-2]